MYNQLLKNRKKLINSRVLISCPNAFILSEWMRCISFIKSAWSKKYRRKMSMADQQHLELLERGAETWNQWRKEHPDIQPNFHEADLSKANFSRAIMQFTTF
jgi:hypothetical protein